MAYLEQDLDIKRVRKEIHKINVEKVRGKILHNMSKKGEVEIRKILEEAQKQYVYNYHYGVVKQIVKKDGNDSLDTIMSLYEKLGANPQDMMKYRQILQGTFRTIHAGLTQALDVITDNPENQAFTIAYHALRDLMMEDFYLALELARIKDNK